MKIKKSSWCTSINHTKCSGEVAEKVKDTKTGKRTDKVNWSKCECICHKLIKKGKTYGNNSSSTRAKKASS